MRGDLERYVLDHTTESSAPLVPELTLRLATLITPLWEGLEARAGRIVPPPFWAFPWVGGQALARWLLDHPDEVRGRAALDFGAGSGLVALAAARAGASRVLAADIDPLSIAAVRVNASLNGLDVDATTRDVIGESLDDFDVVLVGDMCYEQPLASRLTAWLRREATAGRTVLFGDPGRTYVPSAGLVEVARYEVPTTLELENRTVRHTTVWRLTGDVHVPVHGPA